MFLNNSFIKAILLLLIGFYMFSCAPAPLKDLEKQELASMKVLSSPVNFDKNGQANYRCKIEAFDQIISGVIVFKQVDDSIRVVMITDFGLKVMDINLFHDATYQVNYIMKHIDYKFVRESFALNLFMLMEKNISSGSAVFIEKDDELYYHQDMIFYQKENQTIKVERYRGKNKLIAIAKIQKSAIIDIQQFNPKMTMTLSPLDHAER